MEIVRSARPVREMADVKIWPCSGCRAVHMAVKDMVLNFTRNEFAAFTEAVVDINYSGWESLNDSGLIDLTDHDPERFANAILH